MKNFIPTILISTIGFALCLGLLYNYNSNKKLTKANLLQSIHIGALEEDVKVKTEQVISLNKGLASAKNEIDVLNSKIEELSAIIKNHKLKLIKYKNKIILRNKTIDQLKREIVKLSNQKNTDKLKIAKLHSQITSLNENKGNYENKLTELNQQIDQNNQNLQQIETQSFLRNILNNTTIALQKVSAHVKKDDKSIKKVKNKKWRYTILHFHLQNHNGIQSIVNQEFSAIIRDIDTGRILPYNESNPQHPNSKFDHGVQFTYLGNMIQIQYFNNEVKVGNNYNLEIYYHNNNQRYPLPYAVAPIIQDGKIIKL